MSFAPCGARHYGLLRRLLSPRTSSRGSSAGTSRSRLLVDLIRIRQNAWSASHGATSRKRIGASRSAPFSCANTKASGTPSRSCPADTSGGTQLTQASLPSRAISPARPGTVRAFLECAPASFAWKIPTASLRKAIPALPTRAVQVGMAAAWPFPAQRGDDEDTRAQGLSLRDLHPQVDRA